MTPLEFAIVYSSVVYLIIKEERVRTKEKSTPLL